jgi:hypothetical protein
MKKISLCTSKWNVVMLISLIVLSSFIAETLNAQCTIDLGPDQNVCFVPITLDPGAGFANYVWSDGSISQTLVVNTAGTYTVQVVDPADNLIVNGDFESGNSGFTSDYTYVASGGGFGTYSVLTDASTKWVGFDNCDDVTPGLGGAGSMMVVDGADVAGEEVWSQTITVVANMDYAFSTLISNINPDFSHGEVLADLSFSINGVQIGSNIVPSVATCGWDELSTTWNSGGSTVATISILNNNLVPQGNDFALDEIKFAAYCTDTIVITDCAPACTLTPTDITCFGDEDGKLDLVISGGTPNYDIDWDGAVVPNVAGTSATTINETGISAGTYTKTVTDAM